LAEAAGEAVVEAAKGDFDSGCAKLFGLAQQTVVGIVFFGSSPASAAE